MGFLDNLVNEAKKKKQELLNVASKTYDQVNPFDGGRTYQQRTPTRPAASVIQQITHNGATNVIGRDIVKPAYHFMRDGGTLGAAHPGYRNFSRGLTLGAERSLLGTGQAVSGLVNMATQHTLNPAPNRFDNLLNRTAQGVDSQAKNFHVNPVVYKGAQAAGDLAQFAIGSGELKAGAKALSSVPKVGGVVRAAGTVGKAIEVPGQRIAQLGKGGNIGQRIAAKTAGNILSPKYQAVNAAFTAMQSGKDASHGIQQTPQSLAVNTAIGGVGFPLAGAAGSEIGRLLLPGTKAAGQAVIKGSKTVGRDVKAAQAKVSRNDGITQQQKALDKEYAALQQRMQQTPVNNAIANNNFMAKLDRNRAQHAALESQKVKLSAKDKLLTAQPGLSMKAVHDPGLTPEQNQFIEEYATMLKDMGQGNGVAVVPTADGGYKRVSNNIRDNADKGKRMTNADWFDKARAEIESGKAAYGASQEYKALSQAQPGTPLDVPAGWENIGKPTDAPQVQRSLTTGAKAGKQNISPETAKQLNGKYTVRNTKQLQDTAIQAADKQSLDKTIADAHTALNAETGKITDTQVAQAQQAIERADAAGRIEDAVSLHDKLAEHLTKQGQTIQAASLLYRLSPQGMLYKAMRDIKKADGSVSKALEAKLRGASDRIKQAATPELKQRAQAEFHKLVADNIPQSAAHNALGVWKAGLLSGAKTFGGNVLSNETLYGMKTASDPLSVGFDKALTAIGKTKTGQKLGLTGNRTYAVSQRGALQGTKKGFSTAKDTMQTGIDMRNMGEGGKYQQHGEINFKNPVIQKVFGKPSNFVFRGMSAADQPVYYRTFQQELYRQAKVDGMNKGLRGKNLTSYVDTAVKNPTTQMAQIAKDAADKSVLAQDTAVGSALAHFGQKFPAVQAIVPFTKVPTNFLSRSLDYSPAGYVKALVKEVKNVRKGQGIDQRALSQALGEATTGTGVIFIGATLANGGLLSGAYPQGDPKEAQRWKAEGIQPNSVKLGNKWISLNYLGPLGMLLGAGKDYHDATVRGDSGTVAAIAGAGKNLTGQSFLSGFSGLSDAINNPQQSLNSYVNSQAASVVPSWLNDVANTTDSKQRQANTVTQAMANRVPGARETNPVKQDVYGNPLNQVGGQVNAINPLKPSNDISNKSIAVAEVNRLHNVDPNNKDLQVTPTPVNKTLTIDGKPVKLNDKQRYALQNKVGQATQSAWNKLIKTPEYQQLSDTEKAQALNSLRTDVAGATQRQFVVNNNIATYTKAPSSRQLAVMQNQVDIPSYATNVSNNSGAVRIATGVSPNTKNILTTYNAMSAADRNKAAYSQNNFDYQVAQAQYENDRKQGKLSKTQDIRAQDSLAKAKIGANFSKDVRELYGLNKSDLYAFLTSDPNGKAYADQLNQYDQALHNAGVSSSLKFKYGFAPKSSGGGYKGSGKSLSTLLAEFKLPTTKELQYRTQAANLARHAGMAKKS